MEDNRGERLASLESEVRFVKDIVNQINTKLDRMQDNFVPRAEIEEKLDIRDKRIDKIENNLTWVWRALFTGMLSWIVALISYIFVYLRGGK